jgi:hypothetical protein
MRMGDGVLFDADDFPDMASPTTLALEAITG